MRAFWQARAKILAIRGRTLLDLGALMCLKARALLVSVAALLWAASATAEPDTPGEAEVDVVLPSDIVFNGPNVTDQIEQLIRPRASVPDTSDPATFEAVPVLYADRLALVTAFRTLAEAAEAGVNPLAEPGSVLEEPRTHGRSAAPDPFPALPVKIVSADIPADKAIWPAALGAAALLATGFLIFVTALTFRSERRTPKTTG